MNREPRSGCPINLAVELLGDRWSLIVLRDVMLGGRRYFRELLTKSEEGISSNMLADRLKALTEAGMLSRTGDVGHRQKAIYSLTEMSIGLVPIFLHLGAWSRRHLPVSEPMAARGKLLNDGGPEVIERLVAELRRDHLNDST